MVPRRRRCRPGSPTRAPPWRTSFDAQHRDRGVRRRDGVAGAEQLHVRLQGERHGDEVQRSRRDRFAQALAAALERLLMARFDVGEAVVVKTNPELEGVVRRIHDNDGDIEYDVWFGANEQRTYPERSLLGESEMGAATDPASLLAQWQLGDPDRFRSFLTLAKLRTPLADNLYSFVASRTERLPYQFRPILKLLESPYSRMLIADEVGLGKTIEAGIVLMELQARATLDHILIVCPSALRQKWKRELAE